MMAPVVNARPLVMGILVHVVISLRLKHMSSIVLHALVWHQRMTWNAALLKDIAQHINAHRSSHISIMQGISYALMQIVALQTTTHAVQFKAVAKASLAQVVTYIGTTTRCYIVLDGLVQIPIYRFAVSRQPLVHPTCAHMDMVIRQTIRSSGVKTQVVVATTQTRAVRRMDIARAWLALTTT